MGHLLLSCVFGEDIPKDVTILETDLLKEANKELEEYFRGKREKFDLSFDPQGTEFQKKGLEGVTRNTLWENL